MASARIRPDLVDLPAYRPGRPSGSAQASSSPAFAVASNENPYPPLPSVVRVVADAAASVNRYPDMGCVDLVEALADARGVPTDEVVVGPGSVGVLAQLVSAVAAPGDEVVFAWRSFEAYPIVTRVAGATPVPVPLLAGGEHDVQALADAVTDRTRLVLVCTPNNPTGPVLSAQALSWLLDAVPDDVVVAVDEAYAEFVRDPGAADGMQYRERPNVVVLRTFSKAYGLAGLRVGYGLAQPPVATALLKTGVPFGVSSLAQVAAVESLRHRDELAARVQALVNERTRLTAALAAQGWMLPAAEGNFLWFGVGSSTDALSRACAHGGLAVRTFPGEGVRVTVAEPEANDRLLDVVGPADSW